MRWSRHHPTMSTYAVNVKWGRQKFEDIVLDMKEKPLLFKAQLFALTGVQPSRQKVLFKGKILNDDSWEGFCVKEGALFLLMGSVEDDQPAQAVQKPVFLEDLSADEREKALDLPLGLLNLGNTCFMSATIQCLKTVPELVDALNKFRSRDKTPTPTAVLRELGNLFQTMEERDGSEVATIMMLDTLLAALPHFAAKDGQGRLQQQDANELWMELMRMFKEHICGEKFGLVTGKSLITAYFGCVMDVTLTCKEAPQEPPVHSTEEFLQLSCFLSQEVKYLQTGLKAKLSEEIVKYSSTLDRDAVYIRRYTIRRLPAYLTIQMVRFFYKEKDQVSAKILKEVKFPLELDVFDLCGEELQNKLMPARQRIKQAEEEMLQNGEQKNDQNRQTYVSRAQVMFSSTCYCENMKDADDIGSNDSGLYELQAVLTHKGRSSNSGHYVAWIRQPNNTWYSCDDDKVHPVQKEEILRLSGGGDWHSAYVLLYSSKRFPSKPDGNAELNVRKD
ncbi:unnamed protein product [Soboliphyme baturini]|uniref:Ubiquitin carboxyl-terminal hydrolase n=1 Tax=Soboliphyme baturini TaxID=241478 RepID=A0A183IV38_9BILA|nr:unnamed protein product [Soboliphyme baturini]